MTTVHDEYLLGHQDAELRRLEYQASLLEPATAALLTLAGIEPGMRVLDLGSGAGDVAFLAAKRVGPDGSVVGVDRSGDALDMARLRADMARIGNVSFVEGDVQDLDVPGPFDAIVGRLVLLYVDDPAAVVRHCARLLVPGGVFLAMEYEMTATGGFPTVPLLTEAMDWLLAGFARTGHDPTLGARLGPILADAGLIGSTSLGLQVYYDQHDPAAARLLSSTLRTLLPVIVGMGIATDDEVGIDTLEQRLVDAQMTVGAIVKPPTLVGGWGRTIR